MLLLAGVLLIAAAASDSFDDNRAWTLVTVIGAAYILSRGIAKSGTGHAPFLRRRTPRLGRVANQSPLETPGAFACTNAARASGVGLAEPNDVVPPKRLGVDEGARHPGCVGGESEDLERGVRDPQ